MALRGQSGKKSKTTSKKTRQRFDQIRIEPCSAIVITIARYGALSLSEKKKTDSPFQERLSGNDKPRQLHSSGRPIAPCLPKQWAMQASGRKVKCIPGLSCSCG